VGLVLLFAISASAPVVATAAPGTPSIVDTDPDSPAKQNDPSVKGTVGDGDPIQIKLFESSDCTGDPAATGTVAEFAGAGIAVAVPEDVTTALTAIATDAAGNDSACSSSFAYTEDSTAPAAPQVTDTDPHSPGNSNSPKVKGTVGSGDPIQIKLFESSDCTGDPAATGTMAEFAGAGIAVAVAEDATTVLTAIATDAAGNDSACSSPFAYTQDSTATCDAFVSPTGSDISGNGSIASPYQAPQKLVDSLASGETGCFRGGTYTFERMEVTTAGITLTPYRDETVVLLGMIKVLPGGAGTTIKGFKLDGAGGASNIGPRIYADSVTLRDNDITNEHTAICVSIDSFYDGPIPQDVVIERNRIHDCGPLPSTNKAHGVYVAGATGTVIRDNWIYDNADRGIQLYPNAQHTTVTGNVIDGNGDGMVLNGSGAVTSNDNLVEGNIIANSNLGWNVYSGSTGPIGTGNLLRNNCIWASNTNASFNLNGGIQSPSRNFTASGNLISASGFVNAAAGDFHLQWGSACLAKYTGTMSLPVGPPPPPRTLTVQVNGTGTGSITGPGIACPGDCTETYTSGQQVTLTATPSGGSSLGGWGGACSGTAGSCQLTMDADKQVSAGFNPPPPPPPTGSSTLRPNIDLASAWRRIGASSAWAALDDNLLQPTVPNAPDYIQPSAKGQVTTVGFATKALNGAMPRGATVFYYGSTYSGDTRLQLDARWGGVTRATYTLSTGKAFAWRSLSVSPTNQAAVDDLNLRLTTLGGTHTIVTAVYIKLDIS
jgi:parallel beta helix pectate lyase-like protein/List-Bact-rpt repeat protein